MLALACILPIHSDEIIWRLLYSRYFLDGEKLATLTPLCQNEYLIDIPMSWFPLRSIESFFYAQFHSPLSLRLIGVFTYLIWILMLFYFLIKSFEGRFAPKSLLGALFAVTGFGVLPFLFVINRPEPLILIILLLVIFGPIRFKPSTVLVSDKKIKVAFFLTTVIVIWIFFSLHPKTVFFLPVFLVLIFSQFKGNLSKILLIFFLLFIVQDNYKYAYQRTNCSGNLSVNQRDVKILSPSMLYSEPIAFFSIGFNNLSGFIDYIDRGIVSIYFSNQSWIEPINTNIYDVWIEILVYYLSFILFYLFFILIFFEFGVWIKTLGFKKFISKFLLVERIDDYALSMVFALLVSLIFLSFFQGSKAFYETPLIVGNLIYIVSLIFLLIPDFRLNKIFKGMISLIWVLFLFSGFWTLSLYIPTAKKTWLEASGKNERFPWLITLFEFETSKSEFNHALQKCSVNMTNLNFPVVDDFTTLVLFNNIKSPLHTGFLYKIVLEPDDDFFGVLKKFSSSGGVVRCSSLDPLVSERLKQHDGFCCVPPFEKID